MTFFFKEFNKHDANKAGFLQLDKNQLIQRNQEFILQNQEFEEKLREKDKKINTLIQRNIRVSKKVLSITTTPKIFNIVSDLDWGGSLVYNFVKLNLNFLPSISTVKNFCKSNFAPLELGIVFSTFQNIKNRLVLIV